LQGGVSLEGGTVTVSADGNTTTSALSFTPTAADHGLILTCKASNQRIPFSEQQRTWMLRVNYPPKVTLTLGHGLDTSVIKEGSDVYFECHLTANPWVSGRGLGMRRGVFFEGARATPSESIRAAAVVLMFGVVFLPPLLLSALSGPARRHKYVESSVSSAFTLGHNNNFLAPFKRGRWHIVDILARNGAAKHSLRGFAGCNFT
jgi:hypothetical protein